MKSLREIKPHDYLPNDPGVHARAQETLSGYGETDKRAARRAASKRNPVQAKTPLPVACNALLGGCPPIWMHGNGSEWLMNGMRYWKHSVRETTETTTPLSEHVALRVEIRGSATQPTPSTIQLNDTPA